MITGPHKRILGVGDERSRNGLYFKHNRKISVDKAGEQTKVDIASIGHFNRPWKHDMPVRITLLVDGDKTVVEKSEVVSSTNSTEKLDKPSIEVLRTEFMAAIKRNKKAAFDALGFSKCSDVPESEIASKIEALKNV